MLEIMQVINEDMCYQCDQLLTKLVQSESCFDENTRKDYTVKQYYKEKYDKDYACLYLACIDSQPVGFIYGYWKLEAGSEALVYKSTAHIDALFVDEKYRHQGIATKLMQQFNHWCQERQIGIVEIGVLKDNKAALSLYQKQGFEVFSYYMRKEI